MIKPRDHPRSIVFSEGEDDRILRTAVAMIEETSDRARFSSDDRRLSNTGVAKHGLPIDITSQFEIVNPQQDARYRTYWEAYHERMGRRGISPTLAQAVLRTNTT